MEGRALKVKEVLQNPKYAEAWDVYPFNSGYFMCMKLKTADAETLRTHLLEQYGVGIIALGASDVRIAFSCVEEQDLAELFELVYQGVNDLAGA
jgi:aspartate/methionine/tyrosine aminotransferase